MVLSTAPVQTTWVLYSNGDPLQTHSGSTRDPVLVSGPGPGFRSRAEVKLTRGLWRHTGEKLTCLGLNFCPESSKSMFAWTSYYCCCCCCCCCRCCCLLRLGLALCCRATDRCAGLSVHRCQELLRWVHGLLAPGLVTRSRSRSRSRSGSRSRLELFRRSDQRRKQNRGSATGPRKRATERVHENTVGTAGRPTCCPMMHCATGTSLVGSLFLVLEPELLDKSTRCFTE